MADGRRVGKYLKCHISPTNWPTGTQLGWAHPIMYSTCPPCCGCHGNNRCLATAQLGWSHPIMFPTCPPWCGCHGNGRCLATARPLPSNGALNIQQLWASAGRTCEPILMKFGTRQQIKTTVTVTWSNIKFLKSQNGGRPPCWKILEMP